MFKKTFSSLLAFVLLFTTVGPIYSNALASESNESESDSIDLIEIQQLSNDMELTDQEYENIMETTIILDNGESRVIPVPLVVIAVQIVRHGVKWAIKKYGDDVVKAAQKSTAHAAAQNIKSSLLDDNGVKIGLFTQRVTGKQDLKDPKSKWSISRDVGKDNAHGGSYWKLMDKSGKRIATLAKDGKVLRK